MPAAEDRQARALENMARSMGQVVKILEAMNQNFVTTFAALKEAIAKAEAQEDEYQEKLELNLSKMQTSSVRPDFDPREEGDPIQDKVSKAEYERSVRKRFEDEDGRVINDGPPSRPEWDKG